MAQPLFFEAVGEVMANCFGQTAFVLFNFADSPAKIGDIARNIETKKEMENSSPSLYLTFGTVEEFVLLN